MSRFGDKTRISIQYWDDDKWTHRPWKELRTCKTITEAQDFIANYKGGKVLRIKAELLIYPKDVNDTIKYRRDERQDQGIGRN